MINQDIYANRTEDIRKIINKIGPLEQLRVCYKAESTGYRLYRFLLSMDVECEVIAPSLIPQKPKE